MREIVFDTETTGFKFSEGDRLVEIGCVELVNRVETGRTFHAYFNPGRSMPKEAEAVHGLSDAFLADKPAFHTAIDDLLAFLGDSPLIAHNANFDFSFLNGELGACRRDAICLSRMVDTLAIARSRHPGAKHTLDALCVRFGIDRSRRVLHGALLDAQLLAQVYVELMGGRQIGFGLDATPTLVAEAVDTVAPSRVRPPRQFSASEAELAVHAAFVGTLKDPLWGQSPT
ncbi:MULTISPECIES: DNA polymerase III subunit epsilon [unclassified Sphingomonas]|uniref:DNA polymerase III subunit epsilon n=1 Tax=unclassified Sphingomonas TaxID=196159 RepID=UPI0007007A52|nr:MULTISPECIES: DNA polymerase III subunit epsilon [unclassified Sphingomonas]KQM62034.1 DNA polymerase III subunit epsilon [Sphingomonas sp. Leaf16]KQN13435.1 DNA polymerase III subunit epsilon [Sphingomonas sp. Leaf29]KQN23330.1 DNA polymerase III subunit epsilon [Sphingomonas sp. Leaf32]